MATIKKEKKLRQLPDDYKGSLYQSNRLTNALFDFDMIQQRIYVAMMWELQATIIEIMKPGVRTDQLSLFSQDQIIIAIPLRALCKPPYYNRVRAALVEMSNIPFAIPRQFKGENYLVMPKLFVPAIPEDKRSRSQIFIQIERDVAMKLVHIEKDPRTGHPIHWTRYNVEVTMNAKNKYTSKLHIFMSSYKKKGGFTMSMEELRSLLQLKEKYNTYKNFKNRILNPVKKELDKIGDIGFNFSVKKLGNRVTGFDFKVYETHSNLHYVKYKEDTWNAILRALNNNLFKLSKNDIKEFEYIYTDNIHDLDPVHSAISRIYGYLFGHEQRYKGITSIPAYLINSIKKEFPPAPSPE